MSEPFYRYHPGAEIGTNLLSEKEKLINSIVSAPQRAIDLLSQKYKLGEKSDFWDDFIFLVVISPALSKICSLRSLKDAVNKYSELDHALFLKYIRRDEDPIRFRRAFWNVNAFGKHLSSRFRQEFSSKYNLSFHPLEEQSQSATSGINVEQKYKIAFVFKGGFQLAHAEFFREFLKGSKIFMSRVSITLILLDDLPSVISGADLNHINVLSFREYDSYGKLDAYYRTALLEKFDHISWIACVQNLTLYMGQKLAGSQSYWSMKYHSIIMSSLDKYAGLGFGGGSFDFDDIQWFRGRAFPDLSLPLCSENRISFLRHKYQIPVNAVVAGCFVRTEKLNNSDYWSLITKLLEAFPHLHFVVASQAIPEIAVDYVTRPIFQRRFHHLGWVNTKEWCQCLDLYIDSFPRGSCLTALEAIKANVPVIMFDSDHNRESSALPYLLNANKNRVPPGILQCSDLESIYSCLEPFVSSGNARLNLASQQMKLVEALEGTRSLFAKDYLNYFLDSSLSLQGVKSQ